MKKRAALLLCALMICALLVSCAEKTATEAEIPSPAPTNTPVPEGKPFVPPDTLAGTPYTFETYVERFPDSWSTLECTSDEGFRIAELLNTPLVSIIPIDTETGEYTWVFEGAESIEDVTAQYQDDIRRFGVNIGSSENDERGCVYRVTIDPDRTWENGERITAYDHVESMKRLLDPALGNPRARELLLSGAAPAGAEAYFLTEREGNMVPVERLGYHDNASAIAAGRGLCIDMWGFWGLEDAVDQSGAPCPHWLPITDTTGYYNRFFPGAETVSAASLWADYAELFEVGAEYAEYCAVLIDEGDAPKFEDSVGCYAEDERSFIYVCASPVSLDEFLELCSHPWLVYLPYFDAANEPGADGQPAGYCTGVGNTMSCGPYRLSSCVSGKALTLSRNPLWSGWERQDDGSPLAYTQQLVNGEHLEIFKTTRVHIRLMRHDAAEQAFENGSLTEWRPDPAEIPALISDGRLFVSPSTETFRIFFDTDPTSLYRLEGTRGNRFCTALSNYNFRKAMSLAIDREAWCAALGGTPCLGLIGDACTYDPFGSGASYRSSEAGMRALCELYGVEYGGGAAFGSLEAAHDSLDGYDPELAHELLALAADELIEEGLYREGLGVHIRVACSSGELSPADEERIELLNRFMNSAASGTAFGTIEFEGYGNVEDPEAAVASGRFAMGFGVWGANMRDPFSALRESCDSELFVIPEASCWDPSREALTVNVNGEDVTLTWLDWSRALSGEGRYAAEDHDLRLGVLSVLERDLLGKYYTIPVCSGYSGVLLSEKAQFITPDYSPIYGRGGFRFLVYNYSDASWKSRTEE